MPADIETFLVFGAIAAAFAVGSLWANQFLGARPRESYLRLTTYECGEEAEGEAQIDFPTQHYTFAIVFVAVDILGFILALWALNVPVGELGALARRSSRSGSPPSRSPGSTTPFPVRSGGSYERARRPVANPEPRAPRSPTERELPMVEEPGVPFVEIETLRARQFIPAAKEALTVAHRRASAGEGDPPGLQLGGRNSLFPLHWGLACCAIEFASGVRSPVRCRAVRRRPALLAAPVRPADRQRDRDLEGRPQAHHALRADARAQVGHRDGQLRHRRRAVPDRLLGRARASTSSSRSTCTSRAARRARRPSSTGS